MKFKFFARYIRKKLSYTQDFGNLFFEENYWDDHGFQTTFEAYCPQKDGSIVYLGTVNIAKKRASKPSSGKYSTYQDIDLSKEIEYFPEEFISLGNESFYLNLHKHFNNHECQAILQKMNDICYKFDEELWDELFDFKVVNTSFFRGLSKEEASRKIVESLRPIAINGKRNGYDITYTYSFKDKELLKIDFIADSESIYPQNVHAIIGNNGSGKTTFIKDLLLLAIRQELEVESQFTINDERLKIFFSSQDDLKVDSPGDYFSKTVLISFSPFDSLYLKNGIPLGTNGNVEYLGLYKDGAAPLNFEALLEVFSKTIDKIIERRDDWIFFKDILLSQDYQGDISPLVSKIEEAVQGSDVKTHLSEIFTKLSAGQKIILLSITTLIAEVEQNSLVLIDEPELFLHPPMISNYIRSINEIMRRKNGLCILTTHSPIIIQEIPKDCVKIIHSNDGDFIDMIEPEYQTLGENLSTLTNTIFGLNQYQSGFYKLIKEIIQNRDLYEYTIEDIQKLDFGRDGTLYKNLLLSELIEEEEEED
ncbi:ATP-binding cassette domain-containing protein [Lactococcus cremoris]|uniref:AAA family ATPase n=1 Tax=Lactococcus lactis subsp. cremoris TaxID=1359 RepID=UPI00110806C0|nr:AAA family ATPase [Lactococcus cremoris]TLQ07975.1 ATP-binding cassette domain-containing protein [Lactococcus cremoris]